MLAEPLAPVTKVNPVVPDKVNLPWLTLSVICSTPPLASTSNATMRLPLAAEKTSDVLTVVACAPGTMLTGASLTDVTFIVIVRGVGSVSTPPLVVPPSSCTWKLKLA
jgi:hypothetical protein